MKLCHLAPVRPVIRCSLLIPALLAALCVSSANAQNAARRAQNLPGQRAVVIDERLSALRQQPDVKAPLLQRLRRGRVIGISRIGGAKDGPVYCLVAVTRRTRGWILAEAVVRSGRAEDAARLLRMIEESADDFTRARLARICADEFRNTAVAPRALLLLGEAAEAASARLTREARKRARDAGEAATVSQASRRDYLLNHTGLDRWNRAGITFDYEAQADRLAYDGAAYRELLRKYPRSDEAQKARERLESVRSAAKN
ncbi:MAG TPA: hypothetical protein VNQ79_22280 [Blastocatellia bacterium]|nr:hypothetical protein [Blastocatellia bacterium]